MVAGLQRNKPVTLRVSVTDRCQLRCIYCKPEKQGQNCSHHDPLTFNEIMDFVRFLNSEYGLGKVHITGGDPLGRNGISDLVGLLSEEGIDDIALTTNAQMLGKNAAALAGAGLKRINISLDSLNPDTFRSLTRGGELSRTLEGIEKAVDCGLHPVKLNTVVLNGKNDDEVVDIARYGFARNCEVRFLELMPIGVSAEFFDEWFISSDDVMKKLEKKFEFLEKHGGSGSSSRNYIAQDAKGAQGVIGFISPYTASFCNGCRRLRLTSDGTLLGCLAQNKGINLRPVFREKDSARFSELAEAVKSALKIKQKRPHFDTEMTMVSIGG